MSTAIVPGSFDPMTLGHRDIVANVAKRYDRVIVALMINPAKKYLFDMSARLELARRTVADFPNVQVICDRGMLIDLFDRLHADAVCKGWRNEKDYDYELRMADWNRAHNPRFRTELIHAHGGHGDISSTRVRELLAKGESPEALLHPDAWAWIRERMQTPPHENKEREGK